ncbi:MULTISPECIES: bifunctional diguanylate cyclase/phosphodiesterase [unclassified Rhizobium]|uniref:bifunctional diguanylate cyclase/phosphodiesterase n=1 Tax=unclassified Rhizobium TaxID=2613769 RepID=UPI001B31A7A8|nr:MULTISPECIES: bifunctional diguanylate cyclase/phosphodiesterase [unclassified Rhizobium]MBX5255851.1 bifunctional diguanylate cyclase/phosphodiesterase [Rhizobium sp. NLR16b]MBX5261946.1 bifunctional diguanylate cyclase/phosphodiesterase [Rhizobium sp. NLR16a]MBX5310512.1 bifunctional diguanylate cyclase/phosphodiesterase [Rhizobium sp. NLR11b]QTU98171.1 bifunctional diguanylate cyclase/phosphodiesterase [Rhizobium sp. NLR16a]
MTFRKDPEIARSRAGCLTGHVSAFAPAVFAAIIAVIVVWVATNWRLERSLADERSVVAGELATISSRLQTNLNSNVKLLQGLAAGISVDPAMGQNGFSKLAARILQPDSQLRSFAAAPDMVVRWVYPEMENERAIGLDYRKNEKQRAAAMLARNTHNIVLTGPVELVQGGMAFVVRCPVYVTDGNSQIFWGLLSGIIDIPRLYGDSGLRSTDLEVAISTEPEPESPKQVFLGSLETFQRQPVVANVDMTYGRWTLAARPKHGWGRNNGIGAFEFYASLLAFCVVAPIVWVGFLTRSRQRTIEKLRLHKKKLVRARQRLEYLSLHDALTGLPNRRFVDQMISQPPRPAPEDCLILIHIDLDRFKEINDTKGHAGGDIVLQTTALRLADLAGPNDVAARIGGDEFIFASWSANPEPKAAELARHIVDALQRNIFIDGAAYVVGASVGVAWEAEPSRRDLSQLLLNADLALYEAKKAGRGRAAIFTEELRSAAIHSKELADEFNQALERDEFVAFFQPQFDASTLAVAGVEALARWDHPRRGLLGPTEFLDAAERLGRSGDMDKLILQKALFELTRWDGLGLQIPRVSVNISARRLAQANLLAELSALPAARGRLCFELLETISFDELQPALNEVIPAIKALGIEIEIDDFGTEHASIVSLLRFEPRRLKIDREIVKPIIASPSQRRLVSSIIEIGRSQNIDIVAEGVETMEHAKILKDLGCHLLQGYALARPMTSEQLIEFCRRTDKGTAAGR